MTPEAIIKNEIKQAVSETDKSATVILFGSRARGDSRPDSDWDVLILVNKPVVTLKDEQVFRHRLYDVELKLNVPISTFVYAAEMWNTKLAVTPLYKNVTKEGIVL